MESTKLLIAIVGPTASGKSDLAMHLSGIYSGEIICADSRTIYKGMDVGTAKPTMSQREKVPHHCLDLVTPDQRYSVATFKQVATSAIADITNRGKIPILVGGSGLYIDSILYDFDFGSRNERDLEPLDLESLQQIAIQEGMSPSPDTWKNKRHLISYIQRGGVSGRKELGVNTIILGMSVETVDLHERIEQRVGVMFERGLVQEVKTLLEKWGKNAPGFLTPGYRPVIDFIQGKSTLDEAREQFIRNDKLLAKRQMTWFKRNKDIQWINSTEQAEQLIQEKLRSFDTM